MSCQPGQTLHGLHEWRQLLLDQIEAGERKIEELSDEELEIVVGGFMRTSDSGNVRRATQVPASQTMSPMGNPLGIGLEKREPGFWGP